MSDTNDSDGHEGCESSRRGFVKGCGATLAVALAGAGATSRVAEASDGNTVSDLLAGMPDNWGRWGDDDELGAINVLGSEEAFEGMVAATKRGKEGVARFTLQTPLTGEAVDVLVEGAPFEATFDTGDPLFPGRTPGRRDNVADAGDDDGRPPLGPFSGTLFADDKFVTPLFLQGTTHSDALAHAWYDGQLYNGFDAATTHTRREYDLPAPGCDGEPVTETFELGRNDISAAADAGVAARGVLLDVGRYEKSSPPYRLDLGDAVTLEDLQATADAQGVELRERDVVLIRTGAIERVRDPDAAWVPLGEPGLSYSDDLVRWIHEMDFPLVGADNLALEKFLQTVSEDDLDEDREHLAGDYLVPLHPALLRDLGVTIQEALDLSELAAQAAEDGVYEFLYTAAPLDVRGSTGSPTNPVVLKATGDDAD